MQPRAVFFDRQSDVISLMCEDNQSITNTYLAMQFTDKPCSVPISHAVCNTGTCTPGTGTCAIVSQPSEPCVELVVPK